MAYTISAPRGNHHSSPPSTSTTTPGRGGGVGGTSYASPVTTMNRNGGLSVAQVEELRAQNQFLERRIDYLQTVGALFRQKISLIIRDCVRTSHMGPNELQQLYSATMDEIIKAEHETESETSAAAAAAAADDAERYYNGAGDGGAAGSAAPHRALNALKPLQRTVEAKEDVRKAHLICVALQEKNESKQKEMDMRRQLNELTTKHEDLVERHRRMVLLQSGSASTGSGGNGGANSVASSLKELYEGRIKELEEVVLSLKSENVKLKGGGVVTPGNSKKVGGEANSNSNSTNKQMADAAAARRSPAVDNDDDFENAAASGMVAAGSSAGGTVVHEAVEALTRQNHMLKARVHRLKEEVTALKQQSLGSTMQLNEGLDSLLSKIGEQQTQLEDRDAMIQQLTAEKRELAKECVAHRSQVDMYVKQLELFVKDADTTHLSNARTANQSKGEAQNLSSAVDEYLQQIHQKDEAIRSLMQQLREEKQSHQERVLEARALGVQLATFRSKLDAVQAQQSQRDHQQTMMQDMHSRLFSAVQSIQDTQNTAALSAKLDSLSTKLREMETVDLQLRQKEDELVMTKDELDQVRDEKEELLNALGSISAMFTSFPRSVSEVEKIVIQLEEHAAEVRRCAQDHTSPDVLRIEGKVELRLMELADKTRAATRLKQHQNGRRSGSHESSNGNSKKAGGRSKASSLSDSRGGVNNDDDDADGSTSSPPLDDDDRWELELEQQLADIMNIPPLAPISSITDALRADLPNKQQQGGGGDGCSTTATLAATASSPARHQSSSTVVNGLGFLSPSGGPGTVQDVRLTFQLFDDQATGVLPADLLQLCLATLGIQRPVPPTVTAMTEDQFLAFCCGQHVE